MSEHQRYGPVWPHGDWDHTLPGLTAKEEKRVKDFYEKEIRPMFESEEPNRDCSHQCEDCECEKAEPVIRILEYTGHPDVDKFLHETLEIMRKKGHDYRQGNDSDLLHNFRKVAEAVDEPMMKVWFTYFYKHYAALTTFIKNGGQSESEPIEGRISDMIVYLILFHEMIKQKRQAEHGVIV